MVHLFASSPVDARKRPYLHFWDSAVRRHYSTYQELIDARTYELQRFKRYLLSYSSDTGYPAEKITLHLLKAKQILGEVNQEQIDIYKHNDPDIGVRFNRAFNGSYGRIPPTAYGLGFIGFLVGTAFKVSVTRRIGMLALPITFGYIWRMNDSHNERRVLDFLDWAVQFRTAKALIEKNRHLFKTEEVKQPSMSLYRYSQNQKILGDSNLIELGSQLVTLAAAQVKK